MLGRVTPTLAVACLFLLGACGDDSAPGVDRGSPSVDASTPTHDGAGTPTPDTGSEAPEEGFGDVCSDADPCDATRFGCIKIGPNPDIGFCTKPCDNYENFGPCPGAPAGTSALCALSDEAGAAHFCAFVCKTPTATIPCPDTMVCSDTEFPPGSGQFFCESPAS